MAEAELLALIMAGGSGTRFWPLSRKDFPKQFLPLLGDKSLIAQTAERVRSILAGDHLYVVSTARQETLLKVYLPEAKRILEPEGRNTAPCLMLALVELMRAGFSRDVVMAVLPADHYIADEEMFRTTLKRAAAVAVETKGLVTLGIVPASPHTGYGYIEADTATTVPGGIGHQVRRFVEKPDRKTAENFLRQRNFFWNGGIFVWTLGALADAFAKFLPQDWARMSAYRTPAELEAIYRTIESRPVDVAVLEKADNIYVIPVSMGWSDVGSWNALYELRSDGAGANVVVSGDVKSRESRGCLVQVGDKTRVALVGVENLVIVERDGVLLIADRGHDQLVRDISTDFER
jgi:mannose-1-phosphate guanylyltransferase